MIQECRNVFVSWRWLIGIVLTSLLGVSTLAMTYGITQQRQDSQIAQNEHEISIIKNSLPKIEDGLDEILKEMRRR